MSSEKRPAPSPLPQSLLKHKQMKLTDGPTSSIAYDWQRNSGIDQRDYAYSVDHPSHRGPTVKEAAKAEAKNERRKALLQGLSKGDSKIVNSRKVGAH